MMSLGELRANEAEYEVWDPVNGEWVDYKDSSYAKTSGFPDVITANEEITLISASYRGKVYTFATKEWAKRDPNVVYVACATEIEMLKRFMQFYSKLKPDVLTGIELS